MRLAFDHLVHFLHRSSSEATRKFQQAGYHAVAGGRHASWGTWNSLSYFGLSYVEFLAVEAAELAEQSENPLIRQLIADAPYGEGLGQVALRTREMDQWAARFREQGLAVTGPLEGSRTREDGSVIRWRMLFADDPESRCRPPFLIEWGEEDEVRQTDLTERGIIASHPNGSSALDSTGYAVADLETAARSWQRWFGWESGAAFRDEQLGAVCRVLDVPGGSIVLCQPDGEGMAQAALASRGERPFFARFSGGGDKRVDVIFGAVYMMEP